MFSKPQGTELKKGVVTGDEYLKVLNHARANGYAIPAVNCTMSPIVNACLEAAKQANAPMIIQFSNGGGAYMAGTLGVATLSYLPYAFFNLLGPVMCIAFAVTHFRIVPLEQTSN